ncbi:MAG: heme exporter protein CcmD [Rhodospirillales bacterium]|nr:heme exporter protein CcmD [Rhodospirillales bacterium]
MTPFQAFLSMGGYAGYVWPSFAIAALALGALLFASLRSRKATAAELDALETQAGEEASET